MQKGFEKINQEFYINKSALLGKGNFGMVYKGYYLSENKIIAIKFMDKEKLASSPGYERELEVMNALTKFRHPNIMDYYGHVENNDGLYCFLEFCGGGSLKDLCGKKEKDGKETEERQISELKVLTLLRQLLDAMTYINGQSILVLSILDKVHRDLKPDNLLLDQNQELKIADFGLARDVEARMTKGACTPLYASPEVMNLEPYDEKCDVWSAGLILYEMLTGKEYFKHVKTRSQLLQQLKDFSSGIKRVKYPKQLHPQWQVITELMLTHSPLKRPSFEQLLDKFKQMEPKIRKDIQDKYGEQTPGFQGFDDGINLTKSICPYQSRPKQKKNMMQKFEEERSYNNVINLRRFLTFYRLKSDIMIRLVKEFTNNPYGVLRNVYKYILMFLSLSAFICRISFHLKQIRNRKISTPDGQLSINDFTKQHAPEVTKLLQDFTSKHEAALKKFEGVLQKQINAKILGTYMTRPEERQIVQKISETMGNVTSLINRSNKGEFQTEIDYMDIYRNLMNHPDVHLADNVLQSLSEPDLKTYAFIRIVGNLDDVFLNGSYKQEDYLRVKKQEIQNKQSADLIKFIKIWNKLH